MNPSSSRHIKTWRENTFPFYFSKSRAHWEQIHSPCLTRVHVTRVYPCAGVSFCCCCSVTRSCLTLCDPMDYSRAGFAVPHHLPEFVQVHVPWVSDPIQPSHPLPLSSPFAFNLSQHQDLFQWLISSHQVAKVLELQHQSFQWVFRVDFP